MDIPDRAMPAHNHVGTSFTEPPNLGVDRPEELVELDLNEPHAPNLGHSKVSLQSLRSPIPIPNDPPYPLDHQQNGFEGASIKNVSKETPRECIDR